MINLNHYRLTIGALVLGFLALVQPSAHATIKVVAVNHSDTPGAAITWNGVEVFPYGQPFYINDTTGVAYFSYDNFTPPSGFAPITCFRMLPGKSYTVTLVGIGTAFAGSPSSLIVRVTASN